MNQTRENVLVTGATGFIGQHLLFELLPEYAEGRRKGAIYALIRPKAGRGAREFLRSLLGGAWAPDSLRRHPIDRLLGCLRVIEGDLRDADLGEKLARQIEPDAPLQVYHSGGSVNLFDSASAEREIEENNRLGTDNLLAALEGREFRFMFISTAFSSGLREGMLDDSFLTLPEAERYRNPYEAAKRRIERRLADYGETSGKTVQIARPSVVVGRLLEAPLCYTSKFDVIYGWGKFIWTLRRRAWQMPIRVAVNESAALNLVPVDYVAKACVRMSRTEWRELNIVHSRSVPHLEYLSEILRQLDYKDCRWVDRIPDALYPHERMYYRTAGNAFTPYVIHPHNEFDTSRLRALMSDVPEPDVASAIPALLSFAVRHHFDETLLEPTGEECASR